MSKNKKRWLIFSALGLALTGMGLSMSIDAGMLKHSGAQTERWVLYGTFALVVFNSGLSFFGQAVIEKVKALKDFSK